MLDVNALKAELVRNGYTQKKMAEKLGMSARTFTRKLQKEDFGGKEMCAMIEILNIRNPARIFFAQ